jgi:patatin-like phospholipase/acyl hydrolase
MKTISELAEKNEKLEKENQYLKGLFDKSEEFSSKYIKEFSVEISEDQTTEEESPLEIIKRLESDQNDLFVEIDRLENLRTDLEVNYMTASKISKTNTAEEIVVLLWQQTEKNSKIRNLFESFMEDSKKFKKFENKVDHFYSPIYE